MPPQTQAELLALLHERVRSAPDPKTTAADLRDFLTVLVGEVYERTADTAVLEFGFEAGFSDTITRTMGTRQSAVYAHEQLQNVASVAYKKNNVTVTRPFSLAAGDTLSVAITRAVAANPAVVTLLS